MAVYLPDRGRISERKESWWEILHHNEVELLTTSVCIFGAVIGLVNISIKLATDPSMIDVEVRVPVNYLKLPQVAVCPILSQLDFLTPQGTNEESFDFLLLNETGASDLCPDYFVRCFIHNNFNFNCCDYAVTFMRSGMTPCFVFKTLPFDGQQATPGSNAGFQMVVSFKDDSQALESGATLTFANDIPIPFSVDAKELQSVFVRAKTSGFVQLVASLSNYDPAVTDCIAVPKCDPQCTADAFAQACATINRSMCLIEHKDEVEKLANLCLARYCKPRCREWKYTMTYSYVTLDPGRVHNLLLPGEDNFGYLSVDKTPLFPKISEFGHNILLLRIFYCTMFYLEMIEIQTVNFHTVISQLGGIINIWLGLSALKFGVICATWLDKKFRAVTHLPEMKLNV